MTENPHNLRPRQNKERLSDDFQTPENTKCPLCDKKVKDTEDGIICEANCQTWYHCDCMGMTPNTYNLLTNSPTQWTCPHCDLSELRTPQGKLYDRPNNLETSIEDYSPLQTLKSSLLNDSCLGDFDFDERDDNITAAAKIGKYLLLKNSTLKKQKKALAADLDAAHETNEELQNEIKRLTNRQTLLIETIDEQEKQMERDKKEHEHYYMLAEKSSQEDNNKILNLEKQLENLQESLMNSNITQTTPSTPDYPSKKGYQLNDLVPTGYKPIKAPTESKPQLSPTCLSKINHRFQELEQRLYALETTNTNTTVSRSAHRHPTQNLSEKKKHAKETHSPAKKLPTNEKDFSRFSVTVSPPISARELKAGETYESLLNTFFSKQRSGNTNSPSLSPKNDHLRGDMDVNKLQLSQEPNQAEPHELTETEPSSPFLGLRVKMKTQT